MPQQPKCTLGDWPSLRGPDKQCESHRCVQPTSFPGKQRKKQTQKWKIRVIVPCFSCAKAPPRTAPAHPWWQGPLSRYGKGPEPAAIPHGLEPLQLPWAAPSAGQCVRPLPTGNTAHVCRPHPASPLTTERTFPCGSADAPGRASAASRAAQPEQRPHPHTHPTARLPNPCARVKPPACYPMLGGPPWPGKRAPRARSSARQLHVQGASSSPASRSPIAAQTCLRLSHAKGKRNAPLLRDNPSRQGQEHKYQGPDQLLHSSAPQENYCFMEPQLSQNCLPSHPSQGIMANILQPTALPSTSPSPSHTIPG